MTIRVAIVGTGKVADQNYLPHIVKNDDVVLSYYNRTQAKAQAMADKYGGRVADLHGRPDGRRSRHRARPDHGDRPLPGRRTLLLAHKPRRIFFEKPLVAMRGQADVDEDDFAKGKELLQRAQAAGTETAMVFNYRFFEQTRTGQGDSGRTGLRPTGPLHRPGPLRLLEPLHRPGARLHGAGRGHHGAGQPDSRGRAWAART